MVIFPNGGGPFGHFAEILWGIGSFFIGVIIFLIYAYPLAQSAAQGFGH